MGGFEQVKLEEQTPPRYSHGQSEAQTIQEPPTHASRRKPLEGAHTQELPGMRHHRPRPRRLPFLRLLPRSPGDQQGCWRSLIPLSGILISTPPSLSWRGFFVCPALKAQVQNDLNRGTPAPPLRAGGTAFPQHFGAGLRHHTPSPHAAAQGSDHPRWG